MSVRVKIGTSCSAEERPRKVTPMAKLCRTIQCEKDIPGPDLTTPPDLRQFQNHCWCLLPLLRPQPLLPALARRSQARLIHTERKTVTILALGKLAVVQDLGLCPAASCHRISQIQSVERRPSSPSPNNDICNSGQT
jgi:hypothetical protein